MTSTLPIPGSLPEASNKQIIATPASQDKQAEIKSEYKDVPVKLSDLEQEQTKLSEIERHYREYSEKFIELGTRPLGISMAPEEIVAVLSYLHAVDQYFMLYKPAAQNLSARGFPAASQRLLEIFQEIESRINVYGDMYKSTTDARSNWDKIQADAAIQVRKNWFDAMQHSQSVFANWVSSNNAANER
jgi:hypothetical protein